MFLSKRFFFFILICWMASSSCLTGKKPVLVQEKNSFENLSEGENLRFTTAFINASKEKMLENYEQAASLYSQCIRINPKSASAMYELAGIYIVQNKFEDALFFAKKASQTDPGNKWYLLQLGECYKHNNRYEEAVSVYNRLVKFNPYEMDYYHEWANAFLLMGKFNDAIKVYDLFEKKFGVLDEISMQKQRLYIKTGKIEKATEEINKLIRLNPREPRYYGMLADMYRANGMFDKALEALDQLSQIDPGNGTIHLKLAELYRSSGKIDKALEELGAAFSNPQLDIGVKIGYILSFNIFIEVNQDKKDQFTSLARILVTTHPEDARAYAIYGDYLYHDHRLEEARENYLKAISLDKNSFALWNQLVLTLTDLKKYDELLKITTEAIDLFPAQPVFFLFNGIANIQLKKFPEAVDMLSRGVKFVVDNKPMLELFYSNLGDAYYQMGKISDSDAAYDKTLEINPENAYVLNNYGYYLSLRKQNLIKAEQMSKKAIEIEPENSAFQDTYGWILYGLGRFEEAKGWLEKAVSGSGSANGIIMEHYGDVLFRLGDVAKALEFWQKAEQSGRYTPNLPKKVKEKMLIE